MENLDLLIEKFKEAKQELQKTEEAESLDKALTPKTIVQEDAARAKTGNPTVTKSEDRDARWAKKMDGFNKAEEVEKAIRGTPGGATRGFGMQGTEAPPAPTAPPARSAAGVRGTPGGATRGVGLQGVESRSAAGVRGTPGGATRGFGVQGTEPLRTYRGRGTLMRSEEVTFNKSGQWKLDKTVNTAVGAPNDAVEMSEHNEEDTAKMDGGDMGLNRGV